MTHPEDWRMRKPTSHVFSQYEQDEKDIEKMVATLDRLIEERQKERQKDRQ